MNPKIIIEVRGGTIVNILSSQEIDIVIADYDLPENGSPPVEDILPQDCLFEDGKAYELYTDKTDPIEMEVRDYLKAIKF